MAKTIKIPKPTMTNIVYLKPFPTNVKVHPTEQIHDLMKLIEMVGFKDPIVIDKDNMIWAGHARLIAAKNLGMEQVPTVQLEGLSEDQKKVFLLMDNKVNESPWNVDNVRIILSEIPRIELEQFAMKFPEALELEFSAEGVATIDGQLPTDTKCPKCGYSW